MKGEVVMTIEFLWSGLCIFLGLMLSIFTKFSIKIIVIALGAGAIVKGLYDFFKLRKLSSDPTFNRLILIRSLASLLVGLLAVFLPLAFFTTAETIIRVLLYLLAVFILASGFMQFFFAAKLEPEDVHVKPMRIEAVSSVFVAIFLFVIATINITGIIRIVGILLVVFGVLYVIYLWRHRTLVINPDSVQDAAEDDVGSESPLQFEQIEDSSSDQEE